MGRSRTLFSLAIICGLALISGAQKKPNQTVQAQPRAMQQDQEKTKIPVRQLCEEMLRQGRYGFEGQFFASNCTVQFGNRTVPLREAVAEGKGWRSAAPDLVMQINKISVSGDMVTVNWTGRGTHTGQGHGLKPTGKPFNMHGQSRFHV